MDKVVTTPPEKPKREGLFRVGALLPLGLLAAVLYLYFLLLFDAHARWALESLATRAVGAEVNIGRLRTSFWGASLEMGDIQVTDADEPARNQLQIGRVRGQLLWDALLRGKVVVEEASIVDVAIDTPRARPGRVLPPPPPDEGASATDALLAEARSRYGGNLLGDLAALVAGGASGTSFDDIGEALASAQRLRGLEAELGVKEQAWRERLAALPGEEQLSGYEARLRQLKRNDFRNVQEVQRGLRELEAIEVEIEAAARQVQGTGNAISGDLQGVQKGLGEVDGLVQQDIRDLGARLKLPRLDAESLSGLLLGPDFADRLVQVRGYAARARAYLPERGPEEKPAQRQERERGTGKDYAFGRPNSYPAFWLKRAVISSSALGAGIAADLEGSIVDLASDPVAIGRPLQVHLKGSFPMRGVYDAEARLVVDHTTPVPAERFSLALGRYAVGARELLASGPNRLGLAEARGRLRFEAQLQGESVDVHLEQTLSDVAYRIEAENDLLREALAGAAEEVSTVEMRARAHGTWSQLEWSARSNLGAALQRSFSRQFQRQLDEGRARVAAAVNERIGAERRRLEAQYASLERTLQGAVAERQAEIKRLEAELERGKTQLREARQALEDRIAAEAERARQAQERQLKEEADKAKQELRKRIGL